jgi:protein-S-isoprenylcysteine O-methyltransferase Ste14
MAEAVSAAAAAPARAVSRIPRRLSAEVMHRAAAVPAPAWAVLLTATALGTHAALWDVQAPWGRAPEAGALAFAAGLAWAGWAWRLLQRASAMPGAGGRVFVDDGPYAWSRHPMYLGLALAMLGTGLAAGAPLMAPAAAAFVAVVHRLHIPREEAALRRAHGAWYSDYAGDVPRWF